MNFLKLFQENNFEPIEYKGKNIRIYDTLPNEKVKSYVIDFHTVNSDWEQGIFLHSKKCHFLINNDFERINGFHLWFSEVPKINHFEILKKGVTELKVWNIWRIDKGPMSYGSNGGAMYSEETDNGRIYYCNDGYPDDDFDDLIFQLNWLL